MSKQLLKIFGLFKWEWFSFVVLWFVIASLFAYYMLQHYELIMAQEREHLVHSAAASEAIIEKNLEDISTTLDKLSMVLTSERGQRGGETNKTLMVRLKTLVSAMPSVETISMLNAQGVVTTSSKAQLVGQSLAHRDYFRAPASSQIHEKLYVSEPFKGIFDDWLIGFSKVIFDSDGVFTGVVLIALNAREYRVIVNTLRPTPQAWGAVAHGDGLLFAWEPDNLAIIGLNLAKPETMFTQHMESGRVASFFSDTVAANNERSLVAIHTINPANLQMSKPLVLAVGRNLDTLHRDIKKEARYILAVLIVLTTVVGMALYLSQYARRATVLRAEKAETYLQKLNQQMNSFFELIPSFIIITDKKRSFYRVNPACHQALGYTAEDFRETPLFEYVHPDDRERTRPAFDDLLAGRSSQHLVFRFRRKDGQYRYLEASMATQNDMIFFAALDVTNRETEKEQLHTLAYHDRLTGLSNRALFFERLHQIVAISLREKKKAAVIFIDLDGFKTINDTHGHHAGDKVLLAMAQRLTGLVRKADTVTRLGGDEFVIILHDVGSENDAVMVARKVLDVVGQDIPLDSGETVRVGASIGISLWPDHGVGIDNLLMAADRAMYQSKKKGKNTFTIASEDTINQNGICFGDEYRVGIKIIDAQHLELASLVDMLSKGLREESKQFEITELVNKLYVSTKHHFNTEHDFMEQYAYPNRERHNEMHWLLLHELQEIGPALCSKGGVFLVDRLHDWLLAHIIEEDIPLGNFLEENGVDDTDILELKV